MYMCCSRYNFGSTKLTQKLVAANLNLGNDATCMSPLSLLLPEKLNMVHSAAIEDVSASKPCCLPAWLKASELVRYWQQLCAAWIVFFVTAGLTYQAPPVSWLRHGFRISFVYDSVWQIVELSRCFLNTTRWIILKSFVIFPLWNKAIHDSTCVCYSCWNLFFPCFQSCFQRLAVFFWGDDLNFRWCMPRLSRNFIPMTMVLHGLGPFSNSARESLPFLEALHCTALVVALVFALEQFWFCAWDLFFWNKTCWWISL